MKGTVLIILMLMAVSSMAQPGDFVLKQSPKRLNKTIKANPSLHSTFFKDVTIGHNYRSEWVNSITVPVLNFKTDFNGFTLEKEGGGKETHTLHVTDGNGNKWVLRSVKKFPEKIIAPQFKGTIAEDIIRDGTSGSYPYSVLSVGTLARAAGVPYFSNTLVYIPDDPALGQFRPKFKNTLAFLELRTWKNNKELSETEDVIRELKKSGDKKVDQQAVLKARLLDNFVMDFDRHESQWEWAQKDSAGLTWYYPIPKDRDQAFFKADGLVPKFLAHKIKTGPLQGLRPKVKNVCTFNHSAAAFDRTFLSEPDDLAWEQAIEEFLSAMSDNAIENALHKQPAEIQPYHSGNIIEVLKNKKAFFKNDMMAWYRFLSRKVSVAGSDDPEVFTIKKNADGTVLVQVKNELNTKTTYKRLFYPAVTKEIRLYGLGGGDLFVVYGDGSPIKIRLIGGAGKDTFSNESGKGKVIAYDVTTDKNQVIGHNIKKHISQDTLNNQYNRQSDEYNSSSFGIHPEYSFDGGLFLGPSYKIITTGFRKEPYAGKHVLFVAKAFNSGAWHLGYNGEFIKVAGNTDILLQADAKLPTVRTNFFGWGNNTVFDKNKGPDYYKVQYNMAEASVMARYWVTPKLQLQYGAVGQYFNIIRPKDNQKYLMALYPSQYNNTFYDSKWYAGGEFRATLNTKDNELIPTSGIYATVYTRKLLGISKSAGTVTQLGSELSLYTDVLLKDHIIIATSFGFDSSPDNVELPQAQYLGFKQNLRGYRYQRFAGETRAYNNTEVRVNFGDVNIYIFKGALGIFGFHDIGRVWMNGQTSHTWHTGYGGGIWLAPYNKIVVVASLTSSKEENIFPMVTLGFQF